MVVLLCVTAFLATDLGPRLRAAPAEEPAELPTIQSALSYYASSIHTLRGRFHWSMEPQPEFKKRSSPDARWMEDLHGTAEFAVDPERGGTYFARTRIFHYSDLSITWFKVRDVATFDGQRGYALVYTADSAPFLELGPPPGLPHRLNITPKDETQLYHFPHGLAGLRLTRLSNTLPQNNLAALLEAGSPRLEGRERVHGQSCYRVGIVHEGRRITSWLDPQHDFLPRRLESARIDAPPGVGIIMQAFAFQRFRDKATGNQLWFPVRGRIENGINQHEIEVVELEINPTLAPGLFRIDPDTLPDGVMVVEKFGGKSWVTGDRTDLWEKRLKLDAAHTAHCEKVIAQRSGQTSEDPIRASASAGGSWLPWGLAAGSALLLVGGLWLVVRSRQGL